MTLALDSWCILRLYRGAEPAASRVENVIQAKPIMSWINLGEVYYIIRRDHSAVEAEEAVRDLRPYLTLDLPTRQRVLEAAAIKSRHRMSYADAFAAATAIAHDAVLLTGDPELLVDGAPWKVEDLRS